MGRSMAKKAHIRLIQNVDANYFLFDDISFAVTCES